MLNGNPDSQYPVLVVEDAADCSATLEVALQTIAPVRVAASAEEALLVLAGCVVAALITDVHLPSMDGFELVSRVRSQPHLATLPILMISGDVDPETPRRALQMGVDAFFPKPYSPSAVRQKLEELIHAR
jgi:PleD family two-component response regulator